MDDLETQVEHAIERAIRSFNPTDPQSYVLWDHELERLEQQVNQASSSPSRQVLLGSLYAHRISIASEVGRLDRVLGLSAVFLRDIQPSHPGLYLVVAQRSHALHLVDEHDEEARVVLETVRTAEIHGGELLRLLNDLSRRHPGILPIDVDLLDKIKQAAGSLRSEGYSSLPQPSDDPAKIEEEIHQMVTELRRINRTMGKALLGGESS